MDRQEIPLQVFGHLGAMRVYLTWQNPDLSDAERLSKAAEELKQVYSLLGLTWDRDAE